MDDKEINDYCNNDVIVIEAVAKLIKKYYILDEEIDKLKLKNKILFIIIALLVILKIIGG